MALDGAPGELRGGPAQQPALADIDEFRARLHTVVRGSGGVAALANASSRTSASCAARTASLISCNNSSSR